MRRPAAPKRRRNSASPASAVNRVRKCRRHRSAAPATRSTPSRAISRQPGTSVATIGRPQAAASSQTHRQALPQRRQYGDMCLLPESPMSSTWPSKVSSGRHFHSARVVCGIEAGLAGSGSPAIRSSTGRLRLASNAWASTKVGSAFVAEQPADKADGNRRRRVRQAASTHRCRLRNRESVRLSRRLPRAIWMAARSSGFCTSTELRLGREQPSQKWHDRRANEEPAFGVREVNAKPRPVSAFRQTIGSPSAASEPTRVGNNAT